MRTAAKSSLGRVEIDVIMEAEARVAVDVKHVGVGVYAG